MTRSIVLLRNKKEWIILFVCAFILNFIWENLHSSLYIHYRSGAITQFILTRAALADAAIISFIVLAVVLSGARSPLSKSFLILLFGFAVAVPLEIWAISAQRWAYNGGMPLIPYFEVGLTPAIQLGITGVISYLFADRFGLWGVSKIKNSA